MVPDKGSAKMGYQSAGTCCAPSAIRSGCYGTLTLTLHASLSGNHELLAPDDSHDVVLQRGELPWSQEASFQLYRWLPAGKPIHPTFLSLGDDHVPMCG